MFVEMRPRYYYPKHRKPQNENAIPFSLRKPIVLKPAVTGVAGRKGGQDCLYELSLVLGCFKQTNFSQVGCASEISAFQKCFYSSKNDVGSDGTKGKEVRKKTLSKDEINALLKKYTKT